MTFILFLLADDGMHDGWAGPGGWDDGMVGWGMLHATRTRYFYTVASQRDTNSCEMDAKVCTRLNETPMPPGKTNGLEPKIRQPFYPQPDNIL